MSDKGRTDSAILASLKLEETRTSVTLRAAQEHKEGIMPHESMQEDRNIVIESCCLVKGNIFGKNVVSEDPGPQECAKKSTFTPIKGIVQVPPRKCPNVDIRTSTLSQKWDVDDYFEKNTLGQNFL